MPPPAGTACRYSQSLAVHSPGSTPQLVLLPPKQRVREFRTEVVLGLKFDTFAFGNKPHIAAQAVLPELIPAGARAANDAAVCLATQRVHPVVERLRVHRQLAAEPRTFRHDPLIRAVDLFHLAPQ